MNPDSNDAGYFPSFPDPVLNPCWPLRAIPGAIHAVAVGVDAHQVQDG